MIVAAAAVNCVLVARPFLPPVSMAARIDAGSPSAITGPSEAQATVAPAIFVLAPAGGVKVVIVTPP